MLHEISNEPGAGLIPSKVRPRISTLCAWVRRRHLRDILDEDLDFALNMVKNLESDLFFAVQVEAEKLLDRIENFDIDSVLNTLEQIIHKMENHEAVSNVRPE